MKGQRIAGAVALLLLAASLLYVVFDDPGIAMPGQPKYRGERTLALDASVPGIEPFEKFNINLENPFIPEELRQVYKEQIRPPKPPKPLTRPKPLPVPAPGPIVEHPPQNPRHWPTADSPDRPTLNCVGLIRNDSEEVLTVRMGVAGEERQLRIGDTIETKIGDKTETWELLDIVDTTATFRDPDGQEQTFTIDTETEMPIAAAAPANPANTPPLPPTIPGPKIKMPAIKTPGSGKQPKQPGQPGGGKQPGRNRLGQPENPFQLLNPNLPQLTPQQQDLLRQYQQRQLQQQQR